MNSLQQYEARFCRHSVYFPRQQHLGLDTNQEYLIYVLLTIEYAFRPQKINYVFGDDPKPYRSGAIRWRHKIFKKENGYYVASMGRGSIGRTLAL